VQSVKLIRDRQDPQGGHRVTCTFCTFNNICLLLLHAQFATVCIIRRPHREQGFGFIAFETPAAAEAFLDSRPSISVPFFVGKHPICCCFHMLVQPHTSRILGASELREDLDDPWRWCMLFGVRADLRFKRKTLTLTRRRLRGHPPTNSCRNSS
jgi:hypothetical protein